jgi:hypothetical protein
VTAPAPSGGPSTLRVGGLALLGVGAVAGIIGLATLATGGNDSGSSAAPSTSISASPDAGSGFTPTDGATPPDGALPDGGVPTDGAPTEGAAPDAGEGGVPIPSFDPAPTGAIGAPEQDGDAGGGPGGSGGDSGGGVEDVRMPLRVYNNSTITGLAARGAADFEAAGWTVTDTGGYNGRIPVSTVYYREGTAEKDAADFLASAFGLRSQPRFEGIQDASPGVIVILTKDYQGA